MKRQFLKDLELDSEVIDKILDEHGSTVNGLRDKLSSKDDEVKTLKSERDDLKDQVTDVKDAQDKINSLQSKYDEATKERDNLKSQIQSNELDKQIIKNVQDAHDVDDVLNFINRDSFEYDDDGNITNFDDVLNSVRDKKPHYFNGDVDPSSTKDPDPQDDPSKDPQDPPQPQSNELQYGTGKGQGAGTTGKNDFVAMGEEWANILNGNK